MKTAMAFIKGLVLGSLWRHKKLRRKMLRKINYPRLLKTIFNKSYRSYINVKRRAR